MSSEAIAGEPPWNFARDARRRWLMHGVLAFIALLPLLLVDMPALVDYPNHLARLHVITAIDTDPVLASNYEVVWGAMPNLAMDLLAPPLAALVPIDVIGRLFVALTMLVLIGGTLALHRVLHGHVGLWPVAVYLLLYNHLLIMGFLNYLFAIGIALALFAAWIASARWPVWVRWAAFPAALIGLYFAHLFAVAVYGICVSGYELARLAPMLRRDWRAAVRQLPVIASQFVPVAVFILATMPDAAESDFLYGPFLAKVRALWSPALTYLRPIDVAVFVFAASVPLAGVATGRMTLAKPLRVPLAVLTAGAAAMPFWIQGAWGSIWYADLRLPTVVALLLVAGLHPKNVSPRIVSVVLCVAAVLFTARIVDVALEWRRVDRDFAEFRTAARVIERGSAILPVQRRKVAVPDGETRYDDAYWHMPAFTVIERAAFVPTLFTDPTKQPVRASPRRREIDTAFGAPIDVTLLTRAANGSDEAEVPVPLAMQEFWRDWPHRFDYVLLTHFGAAANPLPGLLTSVHEGSFFTLYRISPP